MAFAAGLTVVRKGHLILSSCSAFNPLDTPSPSRRCFPARRSSFCIPPPKVKWFALYNQADFITFPPIINAILIQILLSQVRLPQREAFCKLTRCSHSQGGYEKDKETVRSGWNAVPAWHHLQVLTLFCSHLRVTMFCICSQRSQHCTEQGHTAS